MQRKIITVAETIELTGWSKRSVGRHLPFIKSYLIKRPGATRGARFLDLRDLLAYIERGAQGPATQQEDSTEP
jgi:hypothetical protein